MDKYNAWLDMLQKQNDAGIDEIANMGIPTNRAPLDMALQAGSMSGGIKDFRKMSPELIAKYGQEAIDAAKRYRLTLNPPSSPISYNTYKVKEPTLYKTRRAANNARDRADNKYGAYLGHTLEEGIDESLIKPSSWELIKK